MADFRENWYQCVFFDGELEFSVRFSESRMAAVAEEAKSPPVRSMFRETRNPGVFSDEKLEFLLRFSTFQNPRWRPWSKMPSRLLFAFNYRETR